MAIFCTIYYICSYIQTVPQVYKLIKTKSSNDYSLWQVILGFIGMVCWSIYIFMTDQALIVYIGTIIDIVLLVFVDILIFVYYNFDKKKKVDKVGESQNENTPNKES